MPGVLCFSLKKGMQAPLLIGRCVWLKAALVPSDLLYVQNVSSVFYDAKRKKYRLSLVNLSYPVGEVPVVFRGDEMKLR